VTRGFHNLKPPHSRNFWRSAPPKPSAANQLRKIELSQNI
jgi:hypothetical protein